jgi:eukaryotic-like serine/threonine-protein kinase
MIGIPERLTAALADRYRIERELGAGGMATVYLAQDLKHDRPVAVKVLRPELAAVIGAERFVVEIRTTANLQHPHILPLHDSGEADSFLFYVMPYVEGESLRDRLDREKQLPVADAVRIATEVAGALDYAHRHGVIHRDIKPENILLHDGRALVADFGIALAASKAGGSRMTETGMSLGTPHYMSPEQAMGEREITARSDVYALGAVTYEMLTGDPPFTGSTAQAIVAKVLTEKPVPPSKFRDTVPEAVEEAVLVALAKLPADRFESARAFAEALERPGFVTARTRAPVAAARSGTWLRDRRSIGTLAVAAVALGAVALQATRPRPDRGPAEYDVGLSDSAAMWSIRGTGFAVAPAGDFVVYQTIRSGHGELWHRSLLDGATRRIDGTVDGWKPALSVDGRQLAFLRVRGDDWTLEVMPIGGGTTTTLGSSTSDANVQWLADGRVMLVEADGKRIRWFDPGGGPATATGLAYCIMPARLDERDALLCGGGGDRRIHRVDIRDSLRASYLWSSPDSAPILGSNPRVIAGRYLVYVSLGGDLLGAPVDMATGRVGRSVRLLSGLGRREYSGAGTYDIASSGTLVYAQGMDHAVGHLVAVDERGADTLPVGREVFLRLAFTPDGRRLAAVVEGREGQELRIYDLRTGQFVVWVRRAEIRQPVWSPGGDRLLFSDAHAVFVGSPERASPPESLYTTPQRFEGFSWLPDNRVIGALLRVGVAVALHVDVRPVTVDTLLSDASFTRLSPDGRWIVYNDRSITSLWLEPFPRDGRRYQLAPSRAAEPQWRTNSELVVEHLGPPDVVERLTINTSTNPPEVVRRPWVELPGFLETAGQSVTLAPDGRLVYVRGADDVPVSYLRVIPGWVDRMRRAVDEANW